MDMLTVAADLRDGPVIFVFHTKAPIPDEGWRHYLAVTREEGKKQPAGKPYRGLALTDGAAPNSKQRSEFAAAMSQYSPKPLGAVITESTLVRGAVTAMSWIMDVPRAFSPQNFEAALLHLQIPRDEWPIVHQVVRDASTKLECRIAKRIAGRQA